LSLPPQQPRQLADRFPQAGGARAGEPQHKPLFRTAAQVQRRQPACAELLRVRALDDARIPLEASSSMGFHSDSYEHLEPGTTVSILSLGGPRTLRFRRKDAKEHLIDLRLTSGSLLVMQQHLQATWLHALLPEPDAPPRMSLTFRHII
jgi:hypothetical protein